MQERDTETGQVENHEPEPHSTHPEGPDKSPLKGAPVRPVVNWKNAPAYSLAQMLVKVLSSHTPLPFTYNVKIQSN